MKGSIDIPPNLLMMVTWNVDLGISQRFLSKLTAFLSVTL